MPPATVTHYEEYEYEYSETLSEEEKARRAAEQAKLPPSEMVSTAELAASAGDIGEYGKETGSRAAKEGDRCRVSNGFDQPAEFNLMPDPLTLMEAYLCCDSCNQNPSKQLLSEAISLRLCAEQVANLGCGREVPSNVG